MVFESGTAFADSDADDEYERSARSSPLLGIDSEASPTDSEGLLPYNEQTPTTYGAHISGDRLPNTNITEWTVEECADFVISIGLHQYGSQFLDNEIVGEALVALHHEDLKQMGVTSVGHRLTILKSVYDIKVKQNINIETDHYVPLSADTEAQYGTATLKDIKELVEQLKLRDERMTIAESELRRITLEYSRLREDLLPVFRMVKEGKPLPYPSSSINANGHNSCNYDTSSTISPPAPTSSLQSGNSLARNYSTKKFFIDQPRNLSPTYNQLGHERSQIDQALDPSLVAERTLLSSSHLSASNYNGAISPGHLSPSQPSPTSPQPMHGSTLGSRSYRLDQATPARTTFGQNESDQYASALNSRDSSKPAPLRRVHTPALENPSAGGGSVEIFKSFRVSMDDPCYKVLPAALKKYNINAPWEHYALYIVYGDNERCLDMEEKPLILFKQLDKEGKKPMFMLRKIAQNVDQPGDSGSAGLDRILPRSLAGGYNDPPGGII
ncbi:unnamed protein product [Blumeria hordei]|uniref:MAPKKK cascade protein kinase regulator Ste50 n=2 Tax=Blumeria hordei TaxID=2867405 RepID=A0A383URB0_BLUHO|nr:MAPKKK cascade protein kinase regulator Ste50 [Blumeria hordei DH14]SZF02427.1 unnamed protein product [Blumeria hordei]